jgi:hypothetical protein
MPLGPLALVSFQARKPSLSPADDVRRVMVEVAELDVERGRANNPIETGIALLDRLQCLDDVLRPAEKPPAFTATSIVGNLTVPTSPGSRIAAICSSVKARTRRNSPNIFRFSL